MYALLSQLIVWKGDVAARCMRRSIDFNTWRLNDSTDLFSELVWVSTNGGVGISQLAKYFAG